VRRLSRIASLRRQRQACIERLLPECGDQRLPRQHAGGGPRARPRGEHRAIVEGTDLACETLVGRDERGAASGGCKDRFVHATSWAGRRIARAKVLQSRTLAAGGLRR
jgi:hypothetical protein